MELKKMLASGYQVASHPAASTHGGASGAVEPPCVLELLVLATKRFRLELAMHDSPPGAQVRRFRKEGRSTHRRDGMGVSGMEVIDGMRGLLFLVQSTGIDLEKVVQVRWPHGAQYLVVGPFVSKRVNPSGEALQRVKGLPGLTY